MSRSATALVFTGPEEVTHRSVTVDSPGPEEVIVDTQLSAISPGTELLLYHGQVPTDIAADVAIDALSGDLSYPTQYGYAAVGEVVATGAAVADTWQGRRVFAFHPHQSTFRVAVDDVLPVPSGSSDATCAMLPTVETATNFLLDGAPRIGERAVVFGAGVIGLCTTALLAAMPLESLTVVEPLETRRNQARSMGADRAIPPADINSVCADQDPPGADLVFEVSGHPTALDDAIDVVGYDGRVVVGSWYGDKRSPLDLGSDFHRDRITITSSQVSTISPTLRGRWSTDRRLDTALHQLADIDLTSLVTDRIPFQDAATAYHQLDTNPETTLQVLLTYQ